MGWTCTIINKMFSKGKEIRPKRFINISNVIGTYQGQKVKKTTHSKLHNSNTIQFQNAVSNEHCTYPYIPLTPSSKNFSQASIVPSKLCASPASRRSSIKAVAVNSDTYTVDYSSRISVFPAEACETIGGEACWAGMFPEVKLEPQPQNSAANTASEDVDREYLQYSDAKTVFLGEACDDLGGAFCEREYQRGVY